MAIAKRLVYSHLELGSEAALEDANEHMARSLESEDLAEGVAAFVEKRPPAFAPLR
jgi:enoyl-CoA hydratase/carnithine racemase